MARLTAVVGEALARVLTRNPHIDLLHADLLDTQVVDSIALEDGDPPQAIPRLRAVQRLLRIQPPRDDDDGAPHVAALIDRGVTSAQQIAAMPLHRFVRDHADVFASVEAAREFHERAAGRRAAVGHAWANVRDLVRSAHYRATRFYNADPKLAELFEDVPSYQDLFGDLDYLHCAHCQSIFSPAAYFVDLMRLADEYVAEPNSGTIPDGFRLEQRRPDLFDRELTCANTDGLVPFLTIVDQVLAARIKYETQVDAYLRVAAAPYPFNLPFNRPLDAIRTHLGLVKITLEEIYRELGAPPGAVAREYLRLSIEQYDNLVTVNTTAEKVAPLYGETTLDLQELSKVDTFLQHTRLSRDGLVALLVQDLDAGELAAGLADKFFINATDENLPYLRIVTDTTNPEVPFEKIDYLSIKRLDRLSRFIRLTTALGWDAADVDWAMQSLGATEIAAAIGGLSAMRRLQDRVNQPPDVLAAFWFRLKNIGKRSAANPQDLFDRLFNNPVLLQGRNPYTPGSKVPFDPAQPLDWHVDGKSALDGEIRSRLTAALTVNDTDLTLIAKYLICLTTPASKAADDDLLKTDLATLTSLYRLARIPALAQISVADYLTFLRLMYSPDKKCADRPSGQTSLTIDDAFAQLDAIAWLKASPFTVGDLVWIMTGVLEPGVNPGYVATQLAPFVNGLATVSEPSRLALASFVFEDIDEERSAKLFKDFVDAGFITSIGITRNQETDFGPLARYFPIADTAFKTPDISEQESIAAFGLLREHQVIIAPVEATFGVLNVTFGPETDLSYVFPNDPHKRDEVRNVLLQVRRDILHTVATLEAYEQLQVDTALQGLGNFVGADAAMMSVLLPFAAGRAELADYLEALLTPIPPGGTLPPKVGTLVSLLARSLRLLRRLEFTAAETGGAISDPNAFDITDTVHLSLADVRALSTYRDLTRTFNDTQQALLAFLTSGASRDDRLLALAALTRWNHDQLVALADRFWPAPDPGYGTVKGVARLARAFGMMQRSGLSVAPLTTLEALSTLPLVVNGVVVQANWDTYVADARLTLDAVSAQHDSDAFKTVSRAIVDAGDAASRNALMGYAMWLLRKYDVERPSDLYQYLLIDVEMSPCDTTSYIAQGIASLQLYLQRCRMGLERGVTDVPVPAIWWQWLSNYRIWEANRKVFLYPETYIDPTLRRARSPQFADLQEALLQADVTTAAVTTAYTTYLDHFAKLAQLRIVAAFRFDVPDDAGRTTDTLFLFARTNTDPYVYYWRAVESFTVKATPGGKWVSSGDWKWWRKIEQTIPAPYVTPAYAFGKLFVFWVQFERVSGSVIENQQSVDHTSWTARHYYTFRDFSGAWIQPQSLGEPTVVDFVPDAYLEKALIQPAVFDPANILWQKPYVLHVPSDSYAGRAPFDNAQQLLLLYGNVFRFFPQQPVADPGKPTDRFADQQELNNEVYRSILLRKQLVTGMRPGYAVMKNAQAIAINLLSQQEQAVLLDAPPTMPIYPSPYVGMIDEGNVLNVTQVDGLIASDALFDQHTPAVPPATGAAEARLGHARLRGLPSARPASLAVQALATSTAAALAAPAAPADPSDATTVQLLSGLADTNTAMWTVKNQPGWFVFDNGDDVFLVASQQQPLLSIDTVLRATPNAPAMPAGPMYYYANPFTGPYSGLDVIKFAFARLGTHTIAQLSTTLLIGGLDALLSIPSQQAPELPFSRFTPNTANVIDTTTDTLDFSGAYGPYFWELFFHGPFLVASQLQANRQFDEARRWFQYIFDPTAANDAVSNGAPASGDDRVWRFLPFRNITLQTLIQTLTDVQQIAAYNDDPFDPHAIARLRPGAYPKAVVLRYIDNLLAWADVLFAQDTRESITQATNLYVLAADLIGERPVSPGSIPAPAAKTYRQIRDSYDTTGTAQGGTADTITLAQAASSVNYFYNGLTVAITAGKGAGQQRTIGEYAGGTRVATVTKAWDLNGTPDNTSVYRLIGIPQFLIELENSALTPAAAPGTPVFTDIPFNNLHAYFCVPENAELVAYWDTIDDRLYKIRHCLNIQGVARPLALFEPPIDPRALIRAAAGNAGFTVAGNAAIALPFYRYSVVVERAKELAGALAQLGSSLLSVLEQADGEELNLLRTTQERQILSLTTQIRQEQINEVVQNAAALQASRDAATTRAQFYKKLLTVGLSSAELANLQALEVGLLFNIYGTIVKTAASIGYAVPQVGSPFAMTYGGQQIGNMLNAMSGVFEIGSFISNFIAQRTQTMAGYERRAQDWELQQSLAEHDTRQIDAQIAANAVQRRIAEREYAVHQRSLVQNEELDAFYRRKFTNKELFQWLANRLSTVYFQTYTLAFDLARAAQRAYQFEMNSSDTFINLDYRDPTYRGLLAGEGLALSLNQMDAAYLARNSRTFEIEKTISLMQVNPRALLDLRERGDCTFELSERLFDYDYPGHFARKIKSIALSLPAVLGPYQNIHATLTQLSSQVVLKPELGAVKYLLGVDSQPVPDPSALRTNWWVNQQIALSGGLNDAGLFEVSFSDPRYLPFEGTGAVSTWRLQMPKAANRFDFSAITDVIITLRYTALADGKLRDDVQKLDAIKSYASGRLFALATQFSGPWFAFLKDHSDPAAQTLTVGIAAGLIPPHVTNGSITGLFLQLISDVDASQASSYLSINVPGQPPIEVIVGENNSFALSQSIPLAGPWTLRFTLANTPAALKKDGFLDPERLSNIALVIYYQGSLSW